MRCANLSYNLAVPKPPKRNEEGGECHLSKQS
jgi:hypothetical protein